MIDLSAGPEKVIQDIVKVAKDHRVAWVGEWSKNFRRLAGFTEDDIKSTAANTAVNQPASDAPAKRYVTTFNITRGYYQRLLARGMPSITKFQVLAASHDREDVETATVGSALLRARTSADSGKDFESVLRAVAYLFCGGPSYLRVEPVYPNEQGKYGDVETAAVLPFDVYLFPGIQEINHSPAIVLDERLTLTQIASRYPEFFGETSGEGGEKDGSAVVDFGNVPGAKWPDDVDLRKIAPEIDKGCYLLRRLLILPSRKYPQGKEFVTIVGAEGVVIEREKLDTADGKYPLVQLSDIPMGPFYEDRGRMSISAHMQNTIDKAVSKKLDLTLGSSQLFIGIPAGANTTRDDLTNRAITMYDKVPGQEITLTAAPESPALDNLIGMARDFMAEVHSQHAPSKGAPIGSRTSGRALETLIGQDVAIDEPFLAMMRRSMAQFGKRVLMEGKRVWSEEYQFLVLGRHRMYEARSFRKANLKEGFDVRVLPDQGLPENKAARMQLIIKGFHEGLFADNPDAQRARDLLGVYVDDDNIYAVNQAEETLIRREEEMIDRGEVPPVNWSDNHGLHAIRHRERNTERLASPEPDMRAAAAAEQHAMAHMEKIAPPPSPQVAAQAAAGAQPGASPDDIAAAIAEQEGMGLG